MIQSRLWRKMLTANVVLRSDVTSKMYSVEGASGSSASAARLSHKVILINESGLRGVGFRLCGHGAEPRGLPNWRSLSVQTTAS